MFWALPLLMSLVGFPSHLSIILANPSLDLALQLYFQYCLFLCQLLLLKLRFLYLMNLALSQAFPSPSKFLAVFIVFKYALNLYLILQQVIKIQFIRSRYYLFLQQNWSVVLLILNLFLQQNWSVVLVILNLFLHQNWLVVLLILNFFILKEFNDYDFFNCLK